MATKENKNCTQQIKNQIYLLGHKYIPLDMLLTPDTSTRQLYLNTNVYCLSYTIYSIYKVLF